MIQPFTTKQIRRYLFAYAGIVVLMVLFYFLVSNFYQPKIQEKKQFSTQVLQKNSQTPTQDVVEEKNGIRLLPKKH